MVYEKLLKIASFRSFNINLKTMAH